MSDEKNYLKVRSDGSYGLTAHGDYGPINITSVRPKNPAVIFPIGDKQLAFRLNDEGLIDVECDPADLTEMTQCVVNEIRRMLGVTQKADE